jgi:hypothetical protein
MSDTTTGPPPSGITGHQLLQAVKDNFVLISSVAVILGVGLATTFLAAYLSTFDWHLLWFVQYTDVLTFGLIALGIASSSFIFLQAAAQMILNLFKFDARSKRRWMLGSVILLVAIIAWNVWSSVHQGEGYFHIVSGVLVLALGVVAVLQIVGYVSTGTLPNTVQFTFLLILFVMTAAAGGQWLGYSVLESAKLMDIKLKDNAMSGVKLVVVMSRHTIILKDRDIYVLLTADIAQFHRTALRWEFE